MSLICYSYNNQIKNNNNFQIYNQMKSKLEKENDFLEVKPTMDVFRGWKANEFAGKTTNTFLKYFDRKIECCSIPLYFFKFSDNQKNNFIYAHHQS